VRQDGLKLTAYFAERERFGKRLLADELLGLFGEQRLHTSVLIRGSEGFGRLHHLHTDRLLTLSEDLPLVATAVDRSERIEAVLEPVLRMKGRAIVTLERARLYTTRRDESPPVPSSGQLKLTIYLARRQRAGGERAHLAVTDLLYEHGVAGATVLLGVDGTAAGLRYRARLLAPNHRVPVMVIAVGEAASINSVIGPLATLIPEPLMTLERVQICKRDGRLLAPPQPPSTMARHALALWQKLMVYTSQAATHEGQPVNLQLVRRLREADAAGASCVRGVWGYHGDHAPHGDRLLQTRRHVPVVTIILDTPEGIERSFDIVDELTGEHGLVTCETIPAVGFAQDGDLHTQMLDALRETTAPP
jgi:PII-like signaling protein